MIYIVTYDLSCKYDKQDYQPLINLIKEEGIWAFLGGSSYLVESNLSASQLRDKYAHVLKAADKLFVSVVTAPAAWHGYSKEVSDWIIRKFER